MKKVELKRLNEKRLKKIEQKGFLE